jgi:hypothetical protein
MPRRAKVARKKFGHMQPTFNGDLKMSSNVYYYYYYYYYYYLPLKLVYNLRKC